MNLFKKFARTKETDWYELVPVGGEITEEDQENMIKSAANTLIQAYAHMGRVAPDAVYRAAGKTPPDAQGNTKQRSISANNLFQKANFALREKLRESEDSESYYYYSVENLFFDEGGLYLIISHYNGQLYRSSLDVSAEGQVSVGDLVPVVEGHREVNVERNKFTVFRQKDGKYRLVMRAATAVLNRVGEIDSTELFDNMIRRAETSGVYPSIDYYHLGQFDSIFEMGQCDVLLRSGVVYIASGILNEENILARSLIKRMESGEGRWGCSIEYYPFKSTREEVDVGENISVNVYRDGINTRITILPEEDAAAWFTSVVKERAMNLSPDELRKRLSPLMDEEELEAFLMDTGAVNDQAVSRKMVYRGKDEKKVEDAPDTEEDKEEEEEEVEGAEDNDGESGPKGSETPVVELDDELVGEVVRQIKTGLDAENTSLREVLEQLNTSVQAIGAQVSGLVEAQGKTVSRVAKLEKHQKVLEGDWQDDLPASMEDRQRIRVTYRAKEDNQVAEEPTYSDRANETLSKIPSPGSTK